MRRVRVEVTAQDIADGKRRISTRCPIALAARRALECDVRACWGILELPEGRSAGMTKKCNTFIRRFDSGETVKPFSFTVQVP